MQSGYSASIIKIAAGRRREADGFSPGALTAILYIFNSALLYAALFLCRRSTASLYGSSTAPGINPVGRFAETIWSARRDAMGARMRQVHSCGRWARHAMGQRWRAGEGEGEGFKAGERATLPRGQGAKGREGRGGRMCRRCEGLELTRELTRYTDNVDIATYVSGLDTRCIL